MHTVTTFVLHAPSSHLACMVGHPNISSKRLLSRSAWCNVLDESLPALLLRNLILMADLQLMMLWTVMGWAAQLVMTMWGKLGAMIQVVGGRGMAFRTRLGMLPANTFQHPERPGWKMQLLRGSCCVAAFRQPRLKSMHCEVGHKPQCPIASQMACRLAHVAKHTK